ncbi:hypothetical protein QIS74_03237 [Colletotrichum tabaci]|uniref:Uncharacterized protein n=1 Tax=Colletotrichum tabaci TaxID=1209068 RepID=A0AAV9TN59_9PEZI
MCYDLLLEAVERPPRSISVKIAQYSIFDIALARHVKTWGHGARNVVVNGYANFISPP